MSENRILVLGAGYAGMTVAIGIAGRLKKRADVTLVNPVSRFTERLRLHQTVAGQELADLQIPAMLQGTGIRFVQGWVTGIDLDTRRVRLADGPELGFDTLVYALGGVADTATIPGAAENAYTLNSAADARSLAARLTSLHEGTVVVAGGGLTGVESAAEIAESRPGLRVVLLSAGVPGSMMGPKARAYLHGALDRLGVDVVSGVEIAKILPDAVETADGSRIEAGAVLWTAGVRVSPMAAQAGLDVDDQGRIVVDETLRSVSHPFVYAVGDAAAVRQPYGTIHGTCQSGIPTAAHAAASIVRVSRGRPARPFRFGYIHQPVSLGRRDGVIQFTYADDTPRRIFLTGRAAVIYKEFVSSSPWKSWKLLKHYGGAVFWPHGPKR
ncbi:FAD-dependent oxidoreductase [Streptosporangiaceae bacterium NEAU-GS5]|nr:FAD-dependent oxidoreductase [Streptosporangiaceae bacterium NEAU-GS5]